VASSTDQFRQAFREEAHEILVDLESTLLELNRNRDDLNLVNRAFRALHTLKGSGSMFGFDRLAHFAHKLENAFDAVRNGTLAASEDLIDLTLRALDYIRALLVDEPGDDDGLGSALLEQLCRMADTGREYVNRETVSAAPAAADSTPDCGQGSESEWDIYFAPGPQLMRSGSDPLLLIRELGQMGALKARARMDTIPPLAALDAERCYIAWDLVLKTRASLDAVRDVFIFVEDCCDLKIEPAVTPAAPALPAAVDGDRTARALVEPRGSRGGRRELDSPDVASSIRVAAAKLDCFVNLVGELVTVQARLSELAATRDDAEVSEVAGDVERLASALRDNSMDMRMMPIRGTFEKFRRLVHDLARDLGKNVELTIEGAETELDKSVIDQLSDPLMHLIRNSMDHGIGGAEERAARGKSAMASIHLAARYSGACVLISVTDDGRGIDADRVRAKAIERGLIGPDAALSESEIYALIFQPGFSTAKQVSDISGRGVGLDVVRRNIDRLRGSIDVASKAGEGTTVTLRLPLTLAIIDGLLVTVGGGYFVLPLANTLECIELSQQKIDAAGGTHLINVRGEVVPYIRLRDQFEAIDAPPPFEHVMLVDTGEGRYGLVVDSVLGNCQTMIKSLGRLYRHVQTISGATILGNGTVALILDPERLAQDAVRAAGRGPRLHPAATGIGRTRDGTGVKELNGFVGAGENSGASPITN
jgi:two-component system, chemotaxis family, sensor kinase CheA